MTIQIKIDDILPNRVLEIVHELKTSGLVMGMDFYWEYHKPKYNDWSGDATHNRYTIFTFEDEKVAVWFRLKWVGNEV